ncbi:hypothetical protein ANRL1_04132 [Anaerolineae bacterium]|nr:hypothetical protein ANRL1_04132 [Anaerolineae bacterium]
MPKSLPEATIFFIVVNTVCFAVTYHLTASYIMIMCTKLKNTKLMATGGTESRGTQYVVNALK